MPFSPTESTKDWTSVYTNYYRKITTDAGYNCERAQVTTGALIKPIIDKLLNAWIVIADITDNNPNVLYELGVRHALSKRTIVTVQEKSRYIPSDLSGYWYVRYAPENLPALRKELKRIFAEIEEFPSKTDSPVAEFLQYSEREILDSTQRSQLRRLSALLTELSGIQNNLFEILAKRQKASVLYLGCLNDLLDTRYIELSSDHFTRLYELRHSLRTVNTGKCSQPQIVDVTNAIGVTMGEVQKLIGVVRKGRFQEPQNVATLIWRPIPISNRVIPEQYSQACEISGDSITSAAKSARKKRKHR